MKLPQGWHEVTINKFLEYQTILTSKLTDQIDLEVNILACFGSCHVKEIEKLKTKEIIRFSKTLSFLKELPTEKIPYQFKLAGNTYKVAFTIEDMTAGQFMNFSDILKGVKPEDYVYHMADLIGSMCIKRTVGIFWNNGRLSFIRYQYDGYKDNAKIFNQYMSIEQAYPMYVFFCKVMEKFPTATQDYLIKEIKKMKKKQK